MSVTIVSCFYHIEKSKFNLFHYVTWMVNFFKIKTNKIIYTDKKTFNYLFSKINIENIKFIIYEIDDFKVSKDYTIEQWWEQYKMDPEQSYHSIELYKIWNEKSNFIKKSIEKNPFESDYFYYCDVGCFRDDKKIDNFINWPNIEKVKKKGIGDKFTILSVFPFTKDDLKYKDTDDLFKFLNINRLGGGIIGGSKEACLEWHQLFYKMMQTYFQNDKFAGKDQSIMASVYLKTFNTDKDKCEKLFNLVKVANPFCNPWFYLQDYFN